MDADTGYDAIVVTAFGALGVRTAGDALAGIAFLPPGTAPVAPRNALAGAVCAQLAAYLEDPAERFDLPLARSGTPFQQRVWQSIRAIARGGTRCYGDIAGELASSARAVGQACGSNPFPVVVPCHRVVAADGGLGGFCGARGGFRLEAKRWLLRHEGAMVGKRSLGASA